MIYPAVYDFVLKIGSLNVVLLAISAIMMIIVIMVMMMAMPIRDGRGSSISRWPGGARPKFYGVGNGGGGV